MAPQTEGKWIIGGAFANLDGTARGRVARLNADGSLDSTFGNGLAGADSYVFSVRVQPDGKILIGEYPARPTCCKPRTIWCRTIW
jgi:hypothetical protein